MAESKKSSKILTQWPWLSGYSGSVFTDDFIAAIIVTVLVVPQCLAYALLAGLPPVVGIYASVFPMVAYALFGSSQHLQVGPTAVISLMTAAAIAVLPEGTRIAGAAILALLTGVMVMVMGLLRGGFVMNFVSRSVVTAYITGAAFLIIISQIKHILGIQADGTTALEIISNLTKDLSNINPVTILVGAICFLYFWAANKYFAFIFFKLGMKSKWARLLARLSPILAIIGSIAVTYFLGLSQKHGLNIVGEIPKGLPLLTFPPMSLELVKLLWLPALILGTVAFVDGMSTAQTLAARTRSRIDADRELLGLGASNFIAGLSGGYPVNGSMSRSTVGYSAGGKTPVVSLLTALLLALAAMFLTPYLKYLPKSTLAALIMVACFSLFDFKSMWQTFKYSRGDGVTALATFLSVLVFGVQWGVLIGVILAMTLHIQKTLRPNVALVGRFAGTEHYRDASRFNVETFDEVKTLRIDESLYYANARYLEDKVARIVRESPRMTDLILMCAAVNRIDASAVASLETINNRLKSANIRLHFSELHTTVKDRLNRSDLVNNLTGQIFFTQQEAMEELEPDPDWSQFSDHVDIH
ncbi:MAG: SulP family inorganic anion transporter [Hellea sp.]|nr:SulP family inorganic anion transporter [Hellea sp.]